MTNLPLNTNLTFGPIKHYTGVIHLMLSSYGNSEGVPALLGAHPDTGESICTCSVITDDVEKYWSKDDPYITGIKNYSEGEGMLDALLDAGLVERVTDKYHPDGVTVTSGFIEIPLVRLLGDDLRKKYDLVLVEHNRRIKEKEEELQTLKEEKASIKELLGAANGEFDKDRDAFIENMGDDFFSEKWGNPDNINELFRFGASEVNQMFVRVLDQHAQGDAKQEGLVMFDLMCDLLASGRVDTNRSLEVFIAHVAAQFAAGAVGAPNATPEKLHALGLITQEINKQAIIMANELAEERSTMNELRALFRGQNAEEQKKKMN
jgi:hypothetical protein